MHTENGERIESVQLPGYAMQGRAFRLLADGREFAPEAMEHVAAGTWRSGDVEVRLVETEAADGSKAVALEADGVHYVEEVTLLDHVVEPPPEAIHNHRWFNWFDMQQSTAVFLRDPDGGAFASFANPFARAEIDGPHLRVYYRPAMDVVGTFRSDPLVTGVWHREGREIRFEGAVERDGPADREPAYLNLLAAERPVVLDSGEARAVRRAVEARTPWQPSRARSSHWDWGENVYRLHPGDPETQAIYERLFELCAEVGIELVLLTPSATKDAPASTEGPWQHVMWLAMGNEVGHGTWHPSPVREAGAAEPEGMRDVLAMARKRGIAVAAYVNPQFPWLMNEAWRLQPPAGDPEAYGRAPISCMAVPEARDWLISTLRAFVAEYDLDGISLDFVMWHQCHATDHPHEPGVDSVYAQWDGYRKIVAALRENPDAWVECLIGGPNLMPWGALDMTHPCPLVWDNQPQWVPAWPDLSLDRAYANFARRSGWWYRNLAMVPSYKVPGAVGHQANRLHDIPVERGWDWDGARYNLLSGIASGPSTLSFSFLPCWDAAEWAGMRERDGEFYARWTAFARDNAEVLARLEDLYGEPRPGGVDGTMALGDDGRGFVFLANPDFTARRCEVALAEGSLLRELHPEEGRLWAAAVTVEAHELYVLEVVPAAEIVRPALLGALGTASSSGVVLGARGRPGSAARVEALLDGDARVPSTLVFIEDGVSSSLGPWRDPGRPDIRYLVHAADHVVYETEWRPGSRLPGLLAELAPPVAPVDHQLLQPWADPSRLRFFIELDEPRDATVRVHIDGDEVEVRQAYMGTWPDVTDLEEFKVDRNLLGHYVDLTERLHATEDLDEPWHVTLEVTGFAEGSLRGVHVGHLPRRTTDEFQEIDLLGSVWFNAIVDQPSEAPVMSDITAAEILRLHAWTADPPGAVLERDVVYGEADGVKLIANVYRRADTSERQPAVVFVHGGGWSGGDPGFHTAHANLFASRGFVTVNIEYRMHPDVIWPVSLEDAKCAIRWTRAHADELGVDLNRVGVAGGSAGGQLAAMVALTPGRWEGSGGWPEYPSAVQALGMWYPALDMPVVERAWHKLPGQSRELMLEVGARYFGGDYVATSPINYVQADCPATFTITGAADPLTELEQIERFHALLDGVGVSNRLEIIPGAIHGYDLFSRAWHASADSMLAFFEATLSHRGET